MASSRGVGHRERARAAHRGDTVTSEIFDPFETPVATIQDVLLVAASAGTGKTWLLTPLPARWIVEDGGRTDELLMVTFSRTAAAELKSRLRGKLADFRGVLASIVESRPLDVSEAWGRALARGATGRE